MSSMSSTDCEKKLGTPDRRAYAVFGVIALAFTLSSITSTSVSVALPRMITDLDSSLAWVGWTLTGYQLGMCIMMPISGKLVGDWGARRVFLGMVVVFTLSSIMAGSAPNVYVLIFARMMQALAHGAQLTSATSIVSDCFGERRATAIGLFTSIFPIGAVIGPNIGGFLIDHYSWRWLFYGNVPFGVIAVLLGVMLIPQGRRFAQGRRVDAVGIGLFAGGMVAILGAMTFWSHDAKSLGEPLTWVLAVAGVAALVLFLRHEGRTPSPVIELDLLRSRPFFAANVYNFLYGAVLVASTSFMPYFTTVAYGMTAAESGAILTPRSVAMAVGATVSSIFLIRWGYRMPMILGMLCGTASLLLVGQSYHDVSLLGLQVPNIVLISAMMLLLGSGHGIASPPSNNASLDLAPDKVAAVVGIRGMFRSAGSTFGVASTILVASRFQEEAVGLQVVFLALGLVGLVAVSLVFLIPDAARQRFVAARDKRRGAITATD